MTYGVIIHRAGNSWNAHVPGLEGVVATAATRERVIELISQAIPFHLKRLAESGTTVEAVTGSEAFTLVVP